MHEFTVWAPRARRLQFQSARSGPMERHGDRGWWSAKVEEAGPGNGLRPPHRRRP